MTRHVVIDVEATGQGPGVGSLIQIGAVTLDGEEFSCKMTLDPENGYSQGALDSIGLTLEEIYTWPNRADQMKNFHDWLMMLKAGGDHLVSWSDNPAFDWQYINHALHNYCGDNPLGFSMRRIGDMWAGFTGDWKDATSWKKLRKTKHTHDALDDARGNAEALKEIIRRMGVANSQKRSACK